VNESASELANGLARRLDRWPALGDGALSARLYTRLERVLGGPWALAGTVARRFLVGSATPAGDRLPLAPLVVAGASWANGAAEPETASGAVAAPGEPAAADRAAEAPTSSGEGAEPQGARATQRATSVDRAAADDMPQGNESRAAEQTSAPSSELRFVHPVRRVWPASTAPLAFAPRPAPSAQAGDPIASVVPSQAQTGSHDVPGNGARGVAGPAERGPAERPSVRSRGFAPAGDQPSLPLLSPTGTPEQGGSVDPGRLPAVPADARGVANATPAAGQVAARSASARGEAAPSPGATPVAPMDAGLPAPSPARDRSLAAAPAGPLRRAVRRAFALSAGVAPNASARTPPVLRPLAASADAPTHVPGGGLITRGANAPLRAKLDPAMRSVPTTHAATVSIDEPGLLPAIRPAVAPLLPTGASAAGLTLQRRLWVVEPMWHGVSPAAFPGARRVAAPLAISRLSRTLLQRARTAAVHGAIADVPRGAGPRDACPRLVIAAPSSGAASSAGVSGRAAASAAQCLADPAGTRIAPGTSADHETAGHEPLRVVADGAFAPSAVAAQSTAEPTIAASAQSRNAPAPLRALARGRTRNDRHHTRSTLPPAPPAPRAATRRRDTLTRASSRPGAELALAIPSASRAAAAPAADAIDAAPPAPAPAPASAPRRATTEGRGPAPEALAEQVYGLIVRRLGQERARRGR
jgi:hypothetical protein